MVLMILHQFLVVTANLQCEPQGSGNSIAGYPYFAGVQCAAINFHGNFDGATNGSDDPALVVMVNLHMDIEALATPLQYIFDLLILLMQLIFIVSLMVQLIVLMVLQHF